MAVVPKTAAPTQRTNGESASNDVQQQSNTGTNNDGGGSNDDDDAKVKDSQPGSSCSGGGSGGGGGDDDDGVKVKDSQLPLLEQMELRVRKLEEEAEKMKGELFELRDKLEEEEWARKRVELELKKNQELEEGRRALAIDIEREKAKQQLKEMEDRLLERLGDMVKGGGGGDREVVRPLPPPPLPQPEKHRCIVIVDSNGEGATSDSIKNHIPRVERDSYDVKVEVAYTTDEAYNKVDRGLIDVRGAYVVLDNLTNDVRGSAVRKRPPLSPPELTTKVARLREKLIAAGAADIVVCEIKPMEMTDVTPHNACINDFLKSQHRGFGCRTQIRISDLRDGFHVLPQFDSVIDRTYACAIRGVPVPCPTLPKDFIPTLVRRRWEAAWPRVGGRHLNHGW